MIITEVLKTIFTFPDTFLCSFASLQILKVFGSQHLVHCVDVAFLQA